MAKRYSLWTFGFKDECPNGVAYGGWMIVKKIVGYDFFGLVSKYCGMWIVGLVPKL